MEVFALPLSSQAPINQPSNIDHSVAILLCAPITREYLINYARSIIYTTALGLPSLAMIKAVYDFLEAGHSGEARRHLWDLTEYFHSRIQYALPHPRLLTLSPSPPRSPIFSLLTKQPRSLASFCQEHGYVVRPIVPPTVPEGGERVRVCLHAANTRHQVDGLVQVVQQWARQQKHETGTELSSKL